MRAGAVPSSRGVKRNKGLFFFCFMIFLGILFLLVFFFCSCGPPHHGGTNVILVCMRQRRTATGAGLAEDAAGREQDDNARRVGPRIATYWRSPPGRSLVGREDRPGKAFDTDRFFVVSTNLLGADAAGRRGRRRSTRRPASLRGGLPRDHCRGHGADERAFLNALGFIGRLAAV